MGDNYEFEFREFFEGEWMDRQRYYLDQLISYHSSFHKHSDGELKEVISKVLNHYQEYYAAKSRAAQQDVFSLFAPPWFSTYERSFLWITGFKPGIAFSFINKSVKDLSEDQVERCRRLEAETRGKERELSRDLAVIQESAAAINLVVLTGDLGKQEDGRTSHVNEVLEKLKERMESLVQSADYLRLWTAREVLEILNPVQSIKFLAAATQFQIRIRVLGKYRDSQRSY
ncbi:hypothetical protein ACHQM5_020780 [Ranunculus cassubicifolius]